MKTMNLATLTISATDPIWVLLRSEGDSVIPARYTAPINDDSGLLMFGTEELCEWYKDNIASATSQNWKSRAFTLHEFCRLVEAMGTAWVISFLGDGYYATMSATALLGTVRGVLPPIIDGQHRAHQ